MTEKQTFFNGLILLSLISFSFFGSLSHVFNLVLISLVFINFLKTNRSAEISKNSRSVYFALSTIFFIFLIRGGFSDDFWLTLKSLSPMFAVPLVGLLILFQTDCDLRISFRKLAFFSKISIFITVSVYILLKNILGSSSDFVSGFNNRLELLSGNPIPFSLALFGVSVFCLANIKYSSEKEKLTSILFFILGIYIASVLSSTRGTILASLLAMPIVVVFTANSIRTALNTLIVLTLVFGCIWILHSQGYVHIDFFHRLNSVTSSIFNFKVHASNELRLNVWVASIETIKTLPAFGYDISNRFSSIEPNLPKDFTIRYTHPHNDILASIIGTGFIGGIFTVLSLTAPIWAAYLSRDNKETKYYLAFLMVISFFITSNVNTVFFNDISASWLAFSTFLIWNVNKSNCSTQEKENKNSTG